MSQSFHRPIERRGTWCQAYSCPAVRLQVRVIVMLVALLLAGGCVSHSARSGTSVPPEPSTPTRPKPSPTVKPSKGAEVVSTARSLIGVPYQWGGRSPRTGFDCSGFVGYVYSRSGIDVPRTSSAMRSVGRPVKLGNIRAGDLVIYRISKKGKSLHVGIATGKGTFVHAPSSGKGVSESSMSAKYWRQHYLGARRVF